MMAMRLIIKLGEYMRHSLQRRGEALPSSASPSHHIEVLAGLSVRITRDFAHNGFQDMQRRYSADTTSI